MVFMIPTTPMVQLDIDISKLRGCRFRRSTFPYPINSYDVLKHFRSAPHIHTDVLSQDAWDRGVICSDMDYSVYAAPRTRDISRLPEDDATLNATGHGYQGPRGGVQGADIAFYRSHLKYHTMDDSIHGMSDEGARKFER